MRPPRLNDGDVRLYVGDCIEVMQEMDAESVDAVVCDPPYGLEFMGKEWDAPRPSWDKRGQGAERGFAGKARAPVAGFSAYMAGSPFQHWTEEWATEALRVLKPGGHLLAFGGTRTFHRLTCGIEDAGFEVRDCLSWLYGSGFPKSLDVSKAIDKRRDDRADVERVVRWLESERKRSGVTRRQVEEHFGTQNIGQSLFTITPGSTPRVATVEQWEALRSLIGFGDEMDAEVRRLNGRKGEPGESWHEREVVGRGRSAIANKAEGKRHTVGASQAVEFDLTAPATDAAREWQGWGTALKPAWEPVVVARKPLAGTVAENVQQHGTGALNVDGCRIGKDGATKRGDTSANVATPTGWNTGHDIVALNAGRWPANVALDEDAAAMLDAQTDHAPPKPERTGRMGGGNGALNMGRGGEGIGTWPADPGGGASRFFYIAKASRADRNAGGMADNTHPTVKPTDLMRWLVRLVTPPGGIVLDPFAGSGSTLVAARAEGVRAVGIEREDEYARIIADRLAQLSLFSEGMGE